MAMSTLNVNRFNVDEEIVVFVHASRTVLPVSPRLVVKSLFRMILIVAKRLSLVKTSTVMILKATNSVKNSV